MHGEGLMQRRGSQLTKGFTFFAAAVGMGMVCQGVPVLGPPVVALLVPLVVLVSGWRYAAYFVLLNTLVGVPALAMTVPPTLTVWSTLLSAAGPLKAGTELFIASNVPGQNFDASYVVILVSAVLIDVGFVGLLVLVVYLFDRRYVGYVRMLRVLRQVARGWHR
jgi:hypothetical protein